jgi:hypothetical protein
MALTVETGASIANADSYVSLVDAQAYVDARGYSVTLTEGLLLRAMDTLSGVSFKGAKTASTNALAWPRYGVYDAEALLVLPTVIPDGIVNAQIWLAYYILGGDDPAVMGTPAVLMEKVDVINVMYAASNGSTTVVSAMSLPNVRAALKGLVAGEVLGRA